MELKRLFLLDGMALVYRAHFAFAVKPIMTSYGLNASAMLGITNTVVELIQKEKPTHLAMVFDTSAPTARHLRFPAYKAQRQEMPEDLSIAIPHVKRIMDAFRIPVIVLDGYEADDIIGTLARRAEAEGGYETYMVTPDKDFSQLVDERTYMWKPGRQGSDHEVIGVAEVQAQWLVEKPVQVIDILGLWGDASDNIPGVPGIGEKTAKSLIQQFGSIENILANPDKLKGKQKENLINFAEQARLSRDLATIQLDVPLEWDLTDLIRQPLDEPAVQSLLVEFEFNAVGRRLFGENFKAGRGFHRREEGTAAAAASPTETTSDPASATDASAAAAVVPVLKTRESVPHTWQLADTAPARAAALAKAAASKVIGFAVDCHGADPRASEIRGIVLATAAHEAFYLTGADSAALAAEAAALTSDPEVTLTGHDLKESLQVLLLHALPPVQAKIFDVMLAQALIDPEQKGTLGYLSEALLGYALTTPKAVEASGQMLMPGMEPGDTGRADRVMEAADLALQLKPLLEPKLHALEQDRVFYEIESPLIPVLAGMEAAGIRLDPAVLSVIGQRLEKEIADLELSVYDKAGTRFNLNSPKQLGEVLFDRLKLIEKPKKTKTGQYMTGEDILAELALTHPVAGELLAYREASKLKSTYVDALPLAIAPRTGRVHTTFHQVSTATGRLASNNPNLQNIPIRTEAGREIRKAFIAPAPGWSLLSADYSQIELRVMASICRDAHMMEAFEQGIDIHTATAARVHGVEVSGVTGDMRRTAKMVNFGIIYGISAFGLAQRLGIARSEGSRLIDEYFVQYPGVKHYMDSTVEDAKNCGYVETITGRRRYLRDINSSNVNVRKAAERTAINMPIQGTSADMIKIAMTRTAEALRSRGLATRMLLQVHDELVFEVPDEESELIRSLLPGLMQDALPLAVPVVIELGQGADWFTAHA
ncbi:MAG: polymerase [Candidatus Saccharibacteria bacterium]|nr:polymerase [Candidatus Saccharibacteria bacterium]